MKTMENNGKKEREAEEEGVSQAQPVRLTSFSHGAG